MDWFSPSSVEECLTGTPETRVRLSAGVPLAANDWVQSVSTTHDTFETSNKTHGIPDEKLKDFKIVISTRTRDIHA